MKRRKLLIAIGVAALAGSGISAIVLTSAAGASGADSPGMVGFQGTNHAQVAPAKIASGSQWTYYEEDEGPYGHVGCEILTFTSTTFTGSWGDTGTYKSSAKKATLTFINGAAFYSGKFTGTYETADAALESLDEYGGSFKVSDSSAPDNKQTYGPDAVVAGSDPYGVGTCAPES